MSPGLVSLALVAALRAIPAPIPPAPESEAAAEAEPAPQTRRGDKLSFFPLPMYTTVPNEGSTYGAMPVFVLVNPQGAIHQIYAPSISWNKAAGLNTTFRYYRYPSVFDSFSFIAAASTRWNRTVLVTYDHLPRTEGRLTLEFVGSARRNIFFRFFGLGPDSKQEDESSYTRTTGVATARVGYNLPAFLNAGIRLTVRGDRPIEHAVFGLPPLQQVHPDAPGLGGAGMFSAVASLRYDTRDILDYSPQGVALELAGGYTHGLSGFDRFGHISGQARALLMETSWLQGAARIMWRHQLGGDDVPFYYQSSLGGEAFLRGFPDDRFIDRGAWEAEIEQRFRVLRARIFGVTTDWRIDPFVAVGQVFPTVTSMFSHPRVTAGIGLRTWVHPNVLGRVDVAYGGEGIEAYVVLGYPF
jgi:hypothetical protein